jgi:hypothetical protein
VLCARQASLCVNSYSRHLVKPVCAAGILMVVPSPYLLYDNLAIKMYARERRERPKIHHHRAESSAHKDARQVVRFVPLVRVIIRLVIIISKFSLHQI